MEKKYYSLVSMVSKSDIGLNPVTKEIDASDEAWADYIKADGNAKGMRNRAWPMFNAWCEIFGKDRENWSAAEGFVEAVNDVLNVDMEKNNTAGARIEDILEGLGDSPDPMSVSHSPSALTPPTASGKKRKTVEASMAIVKLLRKFHEATEARLGKIAS